MKRSFKSVSAILKSINSGSASPAPRHEHNKSPENNAKNKFYRTKKILKKYHQDHLVLYKNTLFAFIVQHTAWEQINIP